MFYCYFLYVLTSHQPSYLVSNLVNLFFFSLVIFTYVINYCDIQSVIWKSDLAWTIFIDNKYTEALPLTPVGDNRFGSA